MVYKKNNSIWYNNIVGLKKAGVNCISSEDTEKIYEIVKCSDDIEYFLQNYCHIKTLDKGIQKIKLRNYQHKQLDLYLNNRFIALNFPRQSGKTIVTVLYFLWKLLFNEHFTIICLANKDKVAKKIIKDITLIIKQLPIWLQQGVITHNEHRIEFENGSIIEAQATTLDAGRSASANIVYLDEVAFVKKNTWIEFYKGVYPTISSGFTTQVIATSTPNGLNHWYKIVEDSKKGKNDFICMEINWYDVPGRDENFKEQTIKNIGLRAWESEYEIKFLGSAGTLLPGDILQNLVYKDPEEVINIYKEKYQLKIYNKPKEKHNYIITVDPSEGLGGDSDNTGIIVWDISQKDIREQVAVMYTNELAEIEAPFVIEKIAKMYNNAFILAENNKCNIILEDLVRECDYDNLYVHIDFRKGIRMTESSRRKGLRQRRKSEGIKKESRKNRKRKRKGE